MLMCENMDGSSQCRHYSWSSRKNESSFWAGSIRAFIVCMIELEEPVSKTKDWQ